MRRRRSIPWPEILGAVAFLALAVLIFVVACRDQKAREECRARGGRVEWYDCRDVVHCNTYSDGDGDSHTSCYTSRECKWRCADLPAEDPR
jgi:hypothetical protein